MKEREIEKERKNMTHEKDKELKVKVKDERINEKWTEKEKWYKKKKKKVEDLKYKKKRKKKKRKVKDQLKLSADLNGNLSCHSWLDLGSFVIKGFFLHRKMVDMLMKICKCYFQTAFIFLHINAFHCFLCTFWKTKVNLFGKKNCYEIIVFEHFVILDTSLHLPSHSTILIVVIWID